MALLDPDEVARALAGTHWRQAGATIERDRRFEDFAAAIAFVDRVAAAAEAANHHPDVLVHGYDRVRLTLSTHSVGGVTQADIDLARTLDGL